MKISILRPRCVLKGGLLTGFGTDRSIGLLVGYNQTFLSMDEARSHWDGCSHRSVRSASIHRRALGPGISPHTLRHTAATSLMQKREQIVGRRGAKPPLTTGRSNIPEFIGALKRGKAYLGHGGSRPIATSGRSASNSWRPRHTS